MDTIRCGIYGEMRLDTDPVIYMRCRRTHEHMTSSTAHVQNADERKSTDEGMAVSYLHPIHIQIVSFTLCPPDLRSNQWCLNC